MNTHIRSDGLAAIDWGQVALDLDAQGSAVIERLVTPAECQALAALYPRDTLFRSRVVMARHGFGRGEYKYFSYPLPDLIRELRQALYGCSTARATTTACTRISTAIMYSRCRSWSCCPSPGATSAAASS